MAWRSSGGTHRELIENLSKNGLIKDQRIKEAMLQVDRADFTDQKPDAYDDRPQSSKFFHRRLSNRSIDLFSVF